METPINDQTQADLLEDVIENLDAGSQEALTKQIESSHPAEVADLLESLPPGQRAELWEAVPTDQEGEVLTHLHEEARAAIVEEMGHEELVAAVQTMEPEGLAEVIEGLPEEQCSALLATLEQDHRQRLETILNFEDGTAGRLMSTDVISVRSDVTLAVVLRWIRRHESLPPHTDALMVIDADGKYLGKLRIDKLLTLDPDIKVEQTMLKGGSVAHSNMSAHDVAALFERRDLISIAVLGEEEQLLGRITIDDVVDIIRKESDRALLNSAGLNEDADLFAPIVRSAKRRGFWLGINLLTVFMASAVISQFEEVLDKIVSLAVLLPVVASMGGIAGSQTLTLTIRGLALDQIANANVRWLIGKEVAVGALNGLVWAIVVGAVAYVWFDSAGLAATIAAAMTVNLLIAALAGVVIPLVLTRFGIDPALSGAVVLTTVTDIVGFLSFLGLATLILL